MIKFKNIEVSGFGAAFRGLRNPLESWHKSDSFFGIINTDYSEQDYDVTESWIEKENPNLELFSEKYENLFEKYNKWLLEQGVLRSEYGVYDCAFIGPEDMALAQRMILAGDDEAKFARMIHIQMDITSDLGFFKEYDTYKIATTANSTSTMHKLASTPITKECFSLDGCNNLADIFIEQTITNCEQLRKLYLQTNDKSYWRALIKLLPSSWLQTRTVDLNYQTLRHIYLARRNHKLSEWREFCQMIEKLPYGLELICIEKE